MWIGSKIKKKTFELWLCRHPVHASLSYPTQNLVNIRLFTLDKNSLIELNYSLKIQVFDSEESDYDDKIEVRFFVWQMFIYERLFHYFFIISLDASTACQVINSLYQLLLNAFLMFASLSLLKTFWFWYTKLQLKVKVFSLNINLNARLVSSQRVSVAVYLQQNGDQPTMPCLIKIIITLSPHNFQRRN